MTLTDTEINSPSLSLDTPHLDTPHLDTPHRDTALGRRLRVTGRSAVVAVTSYAAIALFSLWVTVAALTPLTLVAPLLIPATWLVRRYAEAHRRSAAAVLGTPVPTPYRTLETPGTMSRVLTILRDRASWRDAAWLFVHAIVGATLSLLSVTLLLAGVFYLIFPFLFAITPPDAFGTALGFVTIDSVGESFALVPPALAAFGLWWCTAEPLARLVARTDRSLLAERRASQPTRYAA